MEVEVVDDLTSFGPSVAGEPVAALSVAEALSEQPGHAHAVPGHSLVARLQAGDGVDVALGDDEEVDGRLRVEVLEGEHVVILVLDLRGTLPRNDSTEDTAGGHVLLPVVYTRVDSKRDGSIIEGDGTWAPAPSAS